MSEVLLYGPPTKNVAHPCSRWYNFTLVEIFQYGVCVCSSVIPVCMDGKDHTDDVVGGIEPRTWEDCDTIQK